MEQEILVFGDRFQHRAIIQKPPGHDHAAPKTGFARRYDSFSSKTGVPFVVETINYAIDGAATGPACDVLSDHKLRVELVDVCEYGFKGKDKAKDEKEALRRVSRYFADIYPPPPPVDPSLPPSAGKTDVGRIGVFVDYNVGFRESYVAAKQEMWKQTDFARLHAAVIAIGDGLNAECVESYAKLRDILIQGSDGASQTIVLVKLKALQSAGMDIADTTTVERCVEKLQHLFGAGDKAHPVAAKLKALSSHLIIIMDNGTFHLRDREGSLQFMPNFKRSDTSYLANELGIYVSAVLAYAFKGSEIGSDAEVEGAIRLAFLAYSHLFDTGLAAERKDASAGAWSPFDYLPRVLERSRLEANGKLQDVIANKDDKFDSFLFSSLSFTLDKPWKRTDQYRPDNDDYRNKSKKDSRGETVFHRIVLHGVQKALRRTPKAPATGVSPVGKIQCPYAEFGDIKLVDNDEIEQYSNCGRIIRNYLSNKDWRKPLSIAVFGKPGIGKSFAVRQLVRLNRNDGDEKPLVFNLAQFDSLDQLTECFHTIQSAVLASKDHPPLIMFDEFDSDFVTPLGWLKYFLAPMQDGEFRGKTGTYQIGRAIFAFAGGTSDSFSKFRNPKLPSAAKGSNDGESAGNGGAHGAVTRESVKLPDFISRLNGYLDLCDLGTYSEKDADNHVMLLKRAMLIRTFLEQHAKPIFSWHNKKAGMANIDAEVIDRLLTWDAYRFGSRSLETIIRASTPINNRLVLASLPPDAQIQHHHGDPRPPRPAKIKGSTRNKRAAPVRKARPQTA
jgi:hypothetical protein